jgi:hypothetical protein
MKPGEREFACVPARAIWCRELSARDWRVLTCIALHANRLSGLAYPSMATIAAMTGIGRGDVPRSIRRLVRLGLLHRQSRAGNSAVNLYTVIIDGGEASASTPIGVSNVADGVSATRLTGCQQICTAGVSTGADLTDKEQNTEQKRTRRASRADIPDAATGEFETFWRVYPHRGEFSDPEKPARAKFEAAVGRGVDPGVITAGAERYRAHVEQEGTEPRFRPQAQTWLNQERWAQLHEAEPARLRVGMN